ncbi:MAG TPA: isoprenylcysteine carboxylmethyltransferase family protein [Kofleriaceae bacterium]
MNDLLGRATIVVMVLGWIGFSVGFALRRREARGRTARRDWVSLLGIVLQMAGFGVAWSLQRQPLGSPFLGRGLAPQTVFFVLTLLLSGWSAWAVIGAVRALGKQWSIQARVLENHELVTAGPFATVRHPIYSAMIAMLVATGFAIGDWRAVLGGLALELTGTWLRVRGEDRLLRETFGTVWEAYAARVPALVPRRLSDR